MLDFDLTKPGLGPLRSAAEATSPVTTTRSSSYAPNPTRPGGKAHGRDW